MVINVSYYVHDHFVLVRRIVTSVIKLRNISPPSVVHLNSEVNGEQASCELPKSITGIRGQDMQLYTVNKSLFSYCVVIQSQ